MVPPDLSNQPGLTNPGSLLPILETGARSDPGGTTSPELPDRNDQPGRRDETFDLPVQAGTAISTRERGEANAYTLITLNPGEILMTVRVWDDRTFQTSIVTTYGKPAITGYASEKFVTFTERPLAPCNDIGIASVDWKSCLSTLR